MKGYYTSQIVQIISYKILIGLKRPRAGLLRIFLQIYVKKKFFFLHQIQMKMKECTFSNMNKIIF